MKEYAFGIDLGGTTAKIGLFKTTGELLEKWEVPTDTSNSLPWKYSGIPDSAFSR